MTTPVPEPIVDVISIGAEPRRAIPVDLVGRRYNVTPPKASFALKFAVTAKVAANAQDSEKVQAVLDEWIAAAFGADAAAIHARLDDPADDLDTPHIGMLIRSIMEAVSGNPITSA